MSSLSRKRVLSSCMRGGGVLVEVLRRARASLARLSSVWSRLPFILPHHKRSVRCQRLICCKIYKEPDSCQTLERIQGITQRR